MRLKNVASNPLIIRLSSSLGVPNEEAFSFYQAPEGFAELFTKTPQVKNCGFRVGVTFVDENLAAILASSFVDSIISWVRAQNASNCSALMVSSTCHEIS